MQFTERIFPSEKNNFSSLSYASTNGIPGLNFSNNSILRRCEILFYK